MKYKCLLTCMFLSVAHAAEGATLEYRSIHSQLVKDLVLTGEIKTGDAKKILAMILDPKSPALIGLVVNSPGGSVDEAIKIAKLVKSLYVSVQVQPNGHCASACFFIFFAGSGRAASGAEYMDPATRRDYDEYSRKFSVDVKFPGVVGLHRPYLTRIDSLNNKQNDAMRLVASYLEGELLPRRLIDLMMSKPSNDIYWLTEADLAEIGHYPPDQEEYFIRNCSYDRNIQTKLQAAGSQGDRTTVKKLMDRLNTSTECLVRITNEAQDTTMRKLKSGWLPY